MNKIILVLSFVLTAFSQNIFAKEIILNSDTTRTTMIELYTSEGCSSCPPAEKWLNSQRSNPQLWKKIIPLAFHVDYWDYIGWKDSFAVPANTLRQTNYRDEGGIRTVYTPEIVNDGKEWRDWYNSRRIPLATQQTGQLNVSIKQQQISAKYKPTKHDPKKLTLHVALLGFDYETPVKAGENSGKSLKHDFVVIGQAAQHSANNTWKIAVPLLTRPIITRQLMKKASTIIPSKKLGIAIWVSEINKQAPLQAVGGWLN